MAVDVSIWGVLSLPLALLLLVHNIYRNVLACFRPDPVRAGLWAALRDATSFEQWEAAGLALDHHYRIDAWRSADKSRAYAWELVGDRLAAFSLALNAGHTQALVHLLQSGLVRNLGNITAPRLYTASFAGTKYLIENYVLQVCEIVRDLVALPVPGEDLSSLSLSPLSPPLQAAVADGRCQLLSLPAKRQLVNSLRTSFGRTALVLQGGSVFGACHIGVARALFLRGLLPRVVVGTGTGALVAALLGTHTDAELPGILHGAGIDLSAFARRRARDQDGRKGASSRLATLVRRLARFWSEGYVLDVTVLEQCVRDNGGDLTFEEAFRRTGRVLNITVVTAGSSTARAVPVVLNHVTAPHVLVWTAAVASNASSLVSDAANGAWYGRRQTPVLSKEVAPDGRTAVQPWPPLADAAHFRHWTHASLREPRHTPLQRVAQLFNVNHFVVSQARPYLVPFLAPSLHSPAMRGAALSWLAKSRALVLRHAGRLARHRLDQLVGLGWLPLAVRRLLLDEHVPGGAHASHNALLLVPDVPVADFLRLLDSPSPDTLHHWITKGERAVWPAVAALKIRCSIELALEQACADLAVPSSFAAPSDLALDANTPTVSVTAPGSPPTSRRPTTPVRRKSTLPWVRSS